MRVDICVISLLFLIYERDEREVVRCTSLLPGKRFSTNSSSFADVFRGANNSSLKAQAILTTFALMNVSLSNHHHIYIIARRRLLLIYSKCLSSR